MEIQSGELGRWRKRKEREQIQGQWHTTERKMSYGAMDANGKVRELTPAPPP
jgi:hypothetical protein